MQSTIKKKLFPLAIILLLAIGLVPQMTKAEEGSGITIYVVPAITDSKILPTTSISSDYISNQISIVAAPGQYEPASFVIQAHQDIASLQVEATNLTGANSSIPSSNIDIRVVKCWYQAGEAAAVKGSKTLTPELLLKDDSLVKVENGENYLKMTNGTYVWISEVKNLTTAESYSLEDFPVQDSPTLQPVNIQVGENKQFWVTVKVPDGSPPGIYNGDIQLETPAGLVGELQLELEVLPFNLAQPYLTYSINYGGFLSDLGSISISDKNEEQYTKEMEDLVAHGVRNPCTWQPFTAKLGQSLVIRNETGIDTRALYYLGIQTGNSTDPVVLQALKNRIEALIDYVKSYGVSEVYIYGMDEARGDLLASERDAWNAVHEAGAKVWASGYIGDGYWANPGEDSWTLMGDIQDLLVCIGPPVAQEAANWHSVGHKIWSTGNPQSGGEIPETYRRNYGLLLWQGDYDGAFDCAYQWDYGNIWNDFDGYIYRGHVFAYPTMNGVIDTIEWEGWREGVDDIRYLTTLINEIDKAKANGKDTTAVESWLAALKSSDLTTKSLDVVRSEMIERILSLVEGSPSDTTPPVITNVAYSRISDWPSASTTITWTTDERSNSQVEYGTTQDLGLSTDLDTLMVINHEVILTGLLPNTAYYFRVKSLDASGNLAISDIYSFNTFSSLSTSFIFPTDADNSIVARNGTQINTTVISTYETSGFIDWNRSLVGYWDFNENSGSIANDKSTYGNNGTLKEDSKWADGKFGSALEFDGVDDYLEVPDSASLHITEALTMEAWVNPRAISNYSAIIFKCWYDYSIMQAPDGKFIARIMDADGGLTVAYGKTPVPLNEWTHLVATWQKGDYLRLYINGILDAVSPAPLDKPIQITTQPPAQPLRIGTYGGQYYFNGLIDEVRIWNRALSPEEIKSSYNTNMNGLSHTFADLADGTYQYYAYATDLTGNSTRTETRTITVNTAVIPGDANGDGRVNTADLTILERIIAGLQSPTSGADANQDGRVNTADITAIERMITGTS